MVSMMLTILVKKSRMLSNLENYPKTQIDKFAMRTMN